MTNEKNMTLRQAQKETPQEYEDDADFAARFAFSPSLERLGFDKDKFKHLNKNLVLTHLSNREVKKANVLLKAIQILMNHNQTKYYLLLRNKYGEERKKIDKAMAQEYAKQGYVVLTETNNRFQDTIDVKLGELFGMTSTASGAGASLLKEWKQQRVKQEQTIREEQEPNYWFGGSRKNPRRNNRR